MNTVVCLGGYGQFGLETARLLAERDDVERIVLAGRSLEMARAAAVSIGPKAVGRQVDVDDPSALQEAVRGASLVVTALWDAAKRQDPIIRAAAAAGAHYVDLSGRRPSEDVDRAVREAGVVAVTGAGSSPGLTNMMGRAAADGLEEVEAVLGVMVWPCVLDAWQDLFTAYVPLPGGLERGPAGGRLYPTLATASRDPEETLAVIRDARVAPFWLRLLADPSSWAATVPVLRSAEIRHVGPREEGIDVPLPGGGFTRARPLLTEAGGSDTPRMEGATVQSANVTGFSPAFDDALLEAAQRVRNGADPQTAALDVENALAHDLDAYLLPAEELSALPAYAAVAVGRYDGRLARSTVTLAPFLPADWLPFTSAVQALVAGALLEGTIDARGVRAVEEVAALDADFERRYRARLATFPEAEPLFVHTLDYGDAVGG